MIDFIKSYIVFILFHRLNKLPEEGIELLENNWKNKPTKGIKLWLYNKIKKMNTKEEQTKNTCKNVQCCCKCKYQIELRKHPWNNDFGKGSIMDKCGWVCLNPEIGQGKSGIYSYKQHGMCECYTSR